MFFEFTNQIIIIIVIITQLITQQIQGAWFKMRVELADGLAQQQTQNNGGLRVDALVHYWDNLWGEGPGKKASLQNVPNGKGHRVWLSPPGTDRHLPWAPRQGRIERIFIYFIVFSSEDRKPEPGWYRSPFDGKSLIRQIEVQILEPIFARTYVFRLGSALTSELLQGKISLGPSEKYKTGNLYVYASAGIREPGTGIAGPDSGPGIRIPMGQALVRRANDRWQNPMVLTKQLQYFSPFRNNNNEKQVGLLKLLITKENQLYFELPIEFEKIYGHILDYFEFHVYHVDAAPYQYSKKVKNGTLVGKCQLCEKEFNFGEQIIELHYEEFDIDMHVFHRKCIENWFKNGAYENYCLSCPRCEKPYTWSKENIFRAQPIVSQSSWNAFSHDLFSNSRAELNRLANGSEPCFKRRQAKLAIKFMARRIEAQQRGMVNFLYWMGIRQRDDPDLRAIFVENGQIRDTKWLRDELEQIEGRTEKLGQKLAEMFEFVEGKLEGHARQTLESMGIVEEEREGEEKS